MVVVYGIKNCDTVKKALKCFGEKNIDHRFHDFRKDGLARVQLELWVEELGLDTLLNKRGTTWRKLPEDQKNNLSDQQIIDLLLEYPAMIKRPIFDFGHMRRAGFSKKDQVEISLILMGGLEPYGDKF
ncbi:MAG: Spx/MgsR family RNA polymerase-binding regulatory protein [Emcibacter sp.]|nr:Spx/MgsR family RNA polymerase-binding regulatory protein [Emcibacter sp.]